MRTVENEAYKPPEGRRTLAHSYCFKDRVTEPGHFYDLSQVAQELGFLRVNDFPTKRAVWQVYDRPNHDVPNFPEGATRISSTLAVYDTDSELTHAILRTSREPYPVDEFNRDLAAFTKHYAERPRLLGFPSQELAGKWRNLFIALTAGTIGMGAIDYYTIQSIPGSVINIGAILGEIGGPSAYAALWGLSERHARRSISDLEQYTAGDSAQSTLQGERYHNVTVDIQRELYQTLLQEGADLSPDQFLEKIYGQIPQALVTKRHAEIEQAKYPSMDSPREAGNSLPKLIEVSHILQSVELYLNLANELKTGLASQ